MDRPETQFVWSGESALAYQVLGEGEPDLVYMAGWISNVELNWDHPTMSRFLRGLARSRRLTVTDGRGMGCSERGTPHDVWPLETIMEDIAVVLDEVGSERACFLATDHLGFVAYMFAATYPERTAGVILYDASANYLWSEETPWESTEDHFQRRVEQWTSWNRGDAREFVRETSPSMADDREYVEWWYRYTVLSEGLGSGRASLVKYMRTDVRDPALDPCTRPRAHATARSFRRSCVARRIALSRSACSRCSARGAPWDRLVPLGWRSGAGASGDRLLPQ